MLIGLAGVTSTGKSTMANAIKEHFGDKVVVIDKVSRATIYDHIGFPKETSTDLRQLSQEDRIKFDMGRVAVQIGIEIQTIKDNPANIPVIVDGCAFLKMIYLIHLSGQFMDAKSLDKTVEDTLYYINNVYHSIFYLPVTRLSFTAADHRLFSSEYVRTLQDAMLQRMLTTKLRASLNVVRMNQISFGYVFDEIYKLGVK